MGTLDLARALAMKARLERRRAVVRETMRTCFDLRHDRLYAAQLPQWERLFCRLTWAIEGCKRQIQRERARAADLSQGAFGA